MIKIFSFFVILFFFLSVPQSFASEKNPEILVDGYKIEKYVTDLNIPIAIDFIDSDMFILQKNDGIIHLIQNGKLKEQPILDLEVSNYGEQGLLGITTVGNKIYLFFTEAFHDGGLSHGNKIYEYTWDGEKISNPKLIKSLPGWTHGYNSGVMTHDLENKIFAVSGSQYRFGALQNTPSDESLRCFTDEFCDDETEITFFDSIESTLSCVSVSFHHYTTNPFGHQTEQPDLSDNPFETNPFNIAVNLNSCLQAFIFNSFSNGDWKDTSVVLQVKPSVDSYHAIGIRNSFGITTDPITGNLWMTDNGPDKFDEINLIENKFNGGWAKIIGDINDEQLIPISPYGDFVYSNPEFSWELPIGITALDFGEGQLFSEYDGWLFVADSNNGNIYFLKLNKERNGFDFQSEHLKDLVVNIDPENTYGNFHESMSEIMFGANFGLITDLKFGPDGSLYVVSLMEGTIYRIYSDSV
jgi:glucose/arabinose dehydrogenase